MIEINLKSYPWKYGIVDNALTPDLLLEINKVSESLSNDTAVYDLLDLTTNHMMSESLSHKIVLFADSILDDYINIISNFDSVSPYGYICKPQIHVLNSHTSKLQTDQYKSFIFNICVYQSYTVCIHNKDELIHSEEIGLNQGFMFCPKDQITWNQQVYKSHTVNLYVYFSKLDNWFDSDYRKENLPLLDPTLLAWQTKLFKSNLLIRSQHDITTLF